MSEALAAWRTARSVLCVRLDNIGDVLMTTPALHALRRQSPQRRLALLTSRAGSALGPNLTDIDELIVHEAPWVQNEAADSVSSDLALIETLRSGAFDAAVIFTVYSQSALPAALVCRLAGIPLRLAHCRENPYRLLTHCLRDSDPLDHGRHEVQRQLDLVASIGAHCDDSRLRLRLLPHNRSAAGAARAALGIGEAQPYIVLHPGATAASRRYPVELFAQAVRALSRRPGLPLVFGGSAAEQPLIEQVRSLCGVPTHSLAGALSLGDYAALIADAALLVSSNSAPVHIAAAVDTPVVDLYALTNPQHTPWQVAHRTLSHDVPCRNCYRSVCPQGHHLCLRGVAPAEISHAAAELLSPRRRELAA